MSLIGRAFAAAILISMLAAEASAATLVKPGSATRASERGVTVIRGARPAPDLAAPPAPRAPCPAARIAVTTVWPARAFRIQGFWSGDGLGAASMRAASRRYTQGYYADRIAAGD
jgi:hypothetical protein